MGSETLGLIVLLALIFLAAALVLNSGLPRAVKALVVIALVLRVTGSVGRHAMVFDIYGQGDAVAYLDWGWRYAERFMVGDFSPLWDATLWRRSTWWGTQFVNFPSGMVQALIGPSSLGVFLAFSLLSFLGLVGFGLAFRRAYPTVPVWRYLRWAWLFPALWFWPSSVGKEAIIMMGLGLAIAGFVGKRGRINWPLHLIGLFFVFAIRPQVAAVVIFAIVVGHWLSQVRDWNLAKAVQGTALLVVGIGGIWLSLTYIGIEGFDVDSLQVYLESETARSVSGTTVDGVGVHWAGIPAALVNIFLRPFPWEAQNLMVLFSALEILLFWGIVWYRRHNLVEAIRHWRSDRLVSVAIPFIFLYAVLLGMLMVNMGIIARQRIFLFPFLFFLLEAFPRRRSQAHQGIGGGNAVKRGHNPTAVASARFDQLHNWRST